MRLHKLRPLEGEKQREAQLSAKRGETKAGSLKGASRSMYKSMSEKELDKMASTKTKKLPKHKSER